MLAAVMDAAFADDWVGFAYDEVVRGNASDFCARWAIRAADVFWGADLRCLSSENFDVEE